MRRAPRAFDQRRVFLLALASMLGMTGCFARTFGGKSSEIALLAETFPEQRVKILAREVAAEDCPDGPGYGDYAAAVKTAIASVKGANVLLNVELSTVNSPNVMGASTCVRVSGDAGRLE